MLGDVHAIFEAAATDDGAGPAELDSLVEKVCTHFTVLFFLFSPFPNTKITEFKIWVFTQLQYLTTCPTNRTSFGWCAGVLVCGGVTAAIGGQSGWKQQIKGHF